jgi:hypothetical protein
LSHPNLSENCQSRIVYDVGESVNVCDLEDRWRRDSQAMQAGYRLADRPTSECLGALTRNSATDSGLRSVSAARMKPALLAAETTPVGVALATFSGSSLGSALGLSSWR